MDMETVFHGNGETVERANRFTGTGELCVDVPGSSEGGGEEGLRETVRQLMGNGCALKLRRWSVMSVLATEGSYEGEEDHSKMADFAKCIRDFDSRQFSIS